MFYVKKFKKVNIVCMCARMVCKKMEFQEYHKNIINIK